MKRCSACNTEYEDVEVNFHKNRSTSGGYDGQCKLCVKKRTQLYRENNKAKEAERKRLYYENNKKKETERKRLWRENNKDKVAERNRLHYENNKEQITDQVRLYRQTLEGKAVKQRGRNKRRGAMVSKLTAQEWGWILDDWDFCCAYCGVEFSDSIHPTQDHVIPLSKGGTHTFLNIVPACGTCNGRKGAKLLKPGQPVL